MTTQLHIQTPENVAFGYEIAGIGSRFLAALVDTAIVLFLQAILFGMMYAALELPQLGSWLMALLGLIAFAFLWGYYIFFEMRWNGQSPGKRLVRIRVVRQDGTPISLSESIIRNLIRFIDLLPGSYGVGVIAMFVDRQSRRLGDLAAGVLVVHDQEQVTLASLARQENVRPRWPAPFAAAPIVGTSLPVERLSAEQVELVESFLARHDRMPNPGLLGRQIVRDLCRHMEIPYQTLSISESIDWLTDVIQTYRQRSAG